MSALFGALLIIPVLWLLRPKSAAPFPNARVVTLEEPEILILSGYHDQFHQHFIPLKDFPRSRPGFNHIGGVEFTDTATDTATATAVAIILQEPTPGLLTWKITVNEDCFVVPDWRDTGKREEVICRGPYWAVMVVRHKEVWL